MSVKKYIIIDQTMSVAEMTRAHTITKMIHNQFELSCNKEQQ